MSWWINAFLALRTVESLVKYIMLHHQELSRKVVTCSLFVLLLETAGMRCCPLHMAGWALYVIEKKKWMRCANGSNAHISTTTICIECMQCIISKKREWKATGAEDPSEKQSRLIGLNSDISWMFIRSRHLGPLRREFQFYKKNLAENPSWKVRNACDQDRILSSFLSQWCSSTVWCISLKSRLFALKPVSFHIRPCSLIRKYYC